MKKFFFPEIHIIAIGGGFPPLHPNSFDAIKKGLELGADAVYLRVRFTADRHPVVSDSDIAVGKNSQVKIKETTLKDIENLYAQTSPVVNKNKNKNIASYAGKEKLKTVEEYLKKFPEVRFCLEICDPEKQGTEKLCNIIAEYTADERILFYSYYPLCIKTAKKICPDSAFAFTLKGAVGFYALFKTSLLFLRKKFDYDALLIPEFIGPSYIANPGLIKESAKRGIRVFAFGASGEKQIRRVSESGAAGFITDNISALINNMSSQ